MSENRRKEKLEIKIDAEDAIDNFGSEIFEQNIILFVNEGYNNFKEGIKKAQEEKDHAKMKIFTHTLKTTARYMSSENFALECQEIESETKAPNWGKIENLLPDFFKDLDILYNECIKIYNGIKGVSEMKHEITIESNTHNQINDPNVLRNSQTLEERKETERVQVNTLKSSKTCSPDNDEIKFLQNTAIAFSNSVINKKNSFTLNEKIQENNLLVGGIKNNLASNKKIKIELLSKNNTIHKLLEDNILDSHSPNPNLSNNKIDKYSNMLSDESALYEASSLNKYKNLNLAYNLGSNTPQYSSSSSLEKSRSKLDINEHIKNANKRQETLLFKKKNEISHSSSNLNANAKNQKICIKSLRNIDKPMIGSYFKPKIEDKLKTAITNQEFKSIQLRNLNISIIEYYIISINIYQKLFIYFEII